MDPLCRGLDSGPLNHKTLMRICAEAGMRHCPDPQLSNPNLSLKPIDLQSINLNA